MSDKQLENQSDRREYYRLKESLIMSYVIVGKDDALHSDSANQYAMDLLAEFSSMSQQIKQSVTRMNRSPDLSNCFKILDAKINLLAQTVLYQDKDNDLKRYTADISAGGMSFLVPEKVEEGSELQLQLVLPPELYVLNIMAKVISCKQSDSNDGSYMLSTQFLDTRDTTQDLIVRHIMHSQSDQLRAKKETV